MTRACLRGFYLIFPALVALIGCGDSGGGGASSKDWVGKTFLLDTPALPPAYWVQPKDFGKDLGAYVPQFLIGVGAGTGSDLAITLGTGMSGVQDVCVATTQVTASGSSYPNIDIVAPSFPMRIYDPQKAAYVATTAHDVKLVNVLPGNKDLSTAELHATVDVAELYSLFYQIPNATKESVCSTFSSYGVPCATCTFNNQPYCLTLKAVQVTTAETTPPIQPVASPTCP